MFNAPEIFTNIPDIAQIYAINDAQSEELNQALERLDSNIFLDRMDEETCERWEKILGINALDDDTLEDRRFRIKSKVLEKIPYSYRVIIKKLDVLCPNGYAFIISDDRLSVEARISLKSLKMVDTVDEFFDNVIPLNMTYVVSVLWNTHQILHDHTHEELGQLTHAEIVEHVFE